MTFQKPQSRYPTVPSPSPFLVQSCDARPTKRSQSSLLDIIARKYILHRSTKIGTKYIQQGGEHKRALNRRVSQLIYTTPDRGSHSPRMTGRGCQQSYTAVEAGNPRQTCSFTQVYLRQSHFKACAREKVQAFLNFEVCRSFLDQGNFDKRPIRLMAAGILVRYIELQMIRHLCSLLLLLL